MRATFSCFSFVHFYYILVQREHIFQKISQNGLFVFILTVPNKTSIVNKLWSFFEIFP